MGRREEKKLLFKLSKQTVLKMVFLFFIFLILPSITFGKIFINEIMLETSDNTKEEFIELYNDSNQSIDLENFKLTKKTSSGNESNLVSQTKFEGEIDGSGCFLITHPNFKEKFSADLTYSGSSYSIAKNNSVWLYNPIGEIEDSLAFGTFPGATIENPGKGESLALNNSYKISLSASPSPGNCSNKFEKTSIPKVDDKNYSSDIRLNELLPNPKGSDNDNEYIELYNPSSEDIDLENWSLKDSSTNGNYSFPQNSSIKKSSFFIIYRSDFNFAINNSNESIYLLNPKGEIVSQTSFSKSAKEDSSYNFYDQDTWRWSKFLTPEKENKFNNLPTYEIKVAKNIYENIYATFEVKVNDKDRDEIRVIWDFGDAHKSYKKEARHKYTKTGKYKASVKINDGSEEIIDNFKIEVKKFKKRKIRMLALSPNPTGKDTEKEWIKLFNKDKKEVNLNGWSIATGKNSKSMINHFIKEDFILKPGKSRVITREFCAFTLNNKKSRIELRYPDGEVADKVSYKKEKIEEDEIYFKDNKKWKWKIEKILVKSLPKNKTKEIVIEIPDSNFDENLLGQTSKDESKKDNKKIYLLAKLNFTSKKINWFPEGRVLGINNIKGNNKFYSFTFKNNQPHWFLFFLKEINFSINKFLLNFY